MDKILFSDTAAEDDTRSNVPPDEGLWTPSGFRPEDRRADGSLRTALRAEVFLRREREDRVRKRSG
jgi:hypothetical protein